MLFRKSDDYNKRRKTMEQNGKIVLDAANKAKHFIKITANDRVIVKQWLEQQPRGIIYRENQFLNIVAEAIRNVDYDYWIAGMEPSVFVKEIYYTDKREKIGVGFSCRQWIQMAEDYAPERGSRLSNLYELFIWYALRIAKGLWTLDYVANDSSSMGNYFNAPNSSRCMEKTGARVCGGYCDGQGNTYKIVTCGCEFAIVGGSYVDYGTANPVATTQFYNYPDYILNYCTGVLVLTK